MNYIDIDPMTTEEYISAELSASGIYRVDFRPPYMKAAQVSQIMYGVSARQTGADAFFAVALSKLHEDLVQITPVTSQDVFNEADAMARCGSNTWLDTAVGAGYQGDLIHVVTFDPKPRFVIDPTLIVLLSAMNMCVIIKYKWVSLSKAEFDAIANWQGGYKRY